MRKNKIVEFLDQEWGQRKRRDFTFGDGLSVSRFAMIFEKDGLFKENYQKFFFEENSNYGLSRVGDC